MEQEPQPEKGADDKKVHKHKKKIEWMIDYLEKGLKKQRIANKEEARRTITFLETLHDEVDEVKRDPSEKKKKKSKKHDDDKAEAPV